MVSGWAGNSGGRHHGAHGGALSRLEGVRESDFLDFSQNVNPLGAPDAALEAARHALDLDSGRYPDLTYPELREALAGYLGVSPEMVLPTNGGAEALFLAARLAADSGAKNKARIPQPTFSEYATAARTAGLESEHRVARHPENGFRLDLTVFEDLENVAAVFLCNPNNPTGEALSHEEVTRIAGIAREAGAALIVDEAFADFVPEVSVAGEVDDGLIVARSFTKFFGIPGLRLGCLVTSDVERARSFQPSWSVNAVAAAAGISAAGDAEFIRASLMEVPRLRGELRTSLEALPGLTVFPGAANFLLVRGPAGLVEKLARRRVLVRGCEPFLGLGAEYFRVAVLSAGANERLVYAIKEEL